MAKQHKQAKKGRKPARAIVEFTYPVNSEKRAALTGHKDANVPTLTPVNRLCDVLQTLYWQRITDSGVKATPLTLVELLKLYPDKKASLVKQGNLACGALESSLSQGVPCAIPGGPGEEDDPNPEWKLAEEFFADPGSFGCQKDDGTAWPKYSVVLDYSEDRAEGPSQ